MKTRVLFLLLGFLTCTVPAQETFTLARQFKVGEVDKYRSKVTLASSNADFETTIDYMHTERVKKILKDGTAEVEIATNSIEVKILGVLVDKPKLPAFTQRYSKSGVPLGMPLGNKGQATMLDYARIIGPLMDKVLSVGQEYAIDWADPKDKRYKMNGKVRVESVVNGVARIIGNYESWNDKTEKDPVKISLTLMMDISSSKPIRFEGTIENPPDPKVPTWIERGRFVVERVTH